MLIQNEKFNANVPLIQAGKDNVTCFEWWLYTICQKFPNINYLSADHKAVATLKFFKRGQLNYSVKLLETIHRPKGINLKAVGFYWHSFTI